MYPALQLTRPHSLFRGVLWNSITASMQAVLALLYMGLHDGTRVWKSFDWEAMNRLHEKGFITDPRSKAMSVLFTPEDLRQKNFSSDSSANRPNWCWT